MAGAPVLGVVTVACGAGAEVFPFPWADDRAESFVDQVGARLAPGRGQGGASLSPASLVDLDGARLVLPSANGATICDALGCEGVALVAGSLRNAAVVGAWLAARLHADRKLGVAVVAAGERWPDGSLRPAVGDCWGAGAVIAALLARLPVAMSPESLAAVAAYRAVAGDLGRYLAECVSGRELIQRGFEPDVGIAGQVDSATVVSLLVDGRFVSHR